MDDKSVMISLGTTAGLLLVACIFWCFWRKIGKSRKEAAAPVQEQVEAVGEGRPLLRLESPTFSILRHTTGLPVWPSTRIVPNYSTFRQASQDDDSTDSTRNEGHSKHKNVPSDVYIPPLPESLTLSPSVLEPPTTSGAAAASGNASDASNQAMVPQFDDSVLDDDDYEIHFGTPKTTFIMNKLLPRPPPEPDFDLTKHITH